RILRAYKTLLLASSVVEFDHVAKRCELAGVHVRTRFRNLPQMLRPKESSVLLTIRNEPVEPSGRTVSAILACRIERIVQEHRNDVETSLIRRRRSRRALGNANVVKLIVRERLSRVAPHALRLADEEFEPPFGVLADCVEVTSHVSIKRCI